MSAKPKRAVRKAKSKSSNPGLTTAQREYAKRVAHSLEEFVWTLTVAQLKTMLVYFSIDSSEIRDKDTAVQTLYAYMSGSDGTPSATPAVPDDDVAEVSPGTP
jgi:hypothetical protein